MIVSIDVKIDTFLRISKSPGATTVRWNCTKKGSQIPGSHFRAEKTKVKCPCSSFICITVHFFTFHCKWVTWCFLCSLLVKGISVYPFPRFSTLLVLVQLFWPKNAPCSKTRSCVFLDPYSSSKTILSCLYYHLLLCLFSWWKKTWYKTELNIWGYTPRPQIYGETNPSMRKGSKVQPQSQYHRGGTPKKHNTLRFFYLLTFEITWLRRMTTFCSLYENTMQLDHRK